MIKNRIRVLSILFLLQIQNGCMHTRNITEYSSKEEYFKEIIKEADDSDVEIIMDSSDIPVAAQQIKFENDSLSGILLIESSLEKNFKFDSNKLKSISFRKHWRSMLFGIVIGIILGPILSTAVLHIWTENIFLGSIPYIITGGILGAIAGEKYLFLFNQHSQ